MKVEAFIIAWNEAETIHLTINHYKSFCDKITIYDNYSDDGTKEIAEQFGCEVKTFGIKGVLSDQEYVNLKNNCWKNSDADWVIVCDCDEILHHPRIYDVLHDNIDKATTFKTYGWQVFSENVPRVSWLEETNGFHDSNYSKSIIFNPRKIKEIGYVYGCHHAKIRGDIRMSDDVLTIFHYRNIGGAQRLVKRHEEYRKRLSDINKKWNLGVHYTYEDERRVREWNEQHEKSKTYSGAGIISP
jgi:glycosyltransferase involved in cell wall biosynthesis